MKLLKFVFINFKGSVKSYVSLILSLSFTIAVIYNFAAIACSDNLKLLGERNKDRVEMLANAAVFVLVCFIFFFIWYATDTFLIRRRREMGIYVFMGLTNQKIGSLYAIEAAMTGLLSLVFGLFSGIVLKELFQMILFALAEIEINISFEYRLRPVINTVAIFSVIYLIFMLKGYFDILRSSILDMLSAARKNEAVQQRGIVFLIKAVIGISVLFTGYYQAVSNFAGQYGNGTWTILSATVLVVLGTYLLFGGFIPLVFQMLAKNKRFLYQKQRCLWVNNVIFRMKKNYRTYAIVCILAVCASTAFATGVAMKKRYEKITSCRSVYTFQILSSTDTLGDELTQIIENTSGIAFQNQASLLATAERELVISYSQVERLAQSTNLDFPISEPTDEETVVLSHELLLSLVTDDYGSILLGGQSRKITDVVRIPYLGYFHEQGDIYVVNDEEYERLIPYGTLYYMYNYRITDPKSDFEAANAALAQFREENRDDYSIGKVAIDPNDNENEWIKFMYSICCVLFLIFIFAGGAIMFMKLSNDVYEEKERYSVMKKLGLDESGLSHSLRKELAAAYLLPFAAMTVSTFFAVNALGRMMHEGLTGIYVISVLVVFAVFALCYAVSVRAADRVLLL